jgi:nucleoside-diphosphate-sugar epimerase
MTHELVQVGARTSIKQAIHLIERSPFDEALILTEDGRYLGIVRSTDLRRLLISGVNEADEVGAHPPRYTTRLSEEDRGSEQRRQAVAADLRLAGFYHVPLVTAAGTIREVLSLEDLAPEAGAGESEAPKRVLVVGGAGYLGSVLTRRLLAKGYLVRVLDNFLYGRRALDEIASDPRLEVLEGDMRDIHTCVAALEGVHGVVVLAAIVGDPASSIRPTETIETNVLATQALASACKLQNIARFLYASTCSVYGVGDDLLDEQSPLNPVSLYARTKIASEKIVLDLGDDYFCPTVLRMGTLYGDSPRMRFDLVVNTMAMKSFTDRKIQVFGGKQWRPLLNVEDAADAYVACLEADLKDVGNQVFNVGSTEQNYQIDQIARMVSGAIGDVPIEHDGSSLDARDYRVSFAKIQEAVGFRPNHGIDESARAIYAKLDRGIIRDPVQKIYYNHYFDSTEE